MDNEGSQVLQDLWAARLGHCMSPETAPETETGCEMERCAEGGEEGPQQQREDGEVGRGAGWGNGWKNREGVEVSIVGKGNMRKNKMMERLDGWSEQDKKNKGGGGKRVSRKKK